MTLLQVIRVICGIIGSLLLPFLISTVICREELLLDFNFGIVIFFLCFKLYRQVGRVVPLFVLSM